MKNIFNKILNNANEVDEKEKTIGIIGIVLFVVLIIAVRIGNANKPDTPSNPTPTNNSVEELEKEKEETNNNTNTVSEKEEKVKVNKNADSYTYSYTINYDLETETYLGKRWNDKEKFSYIKGDITLEYAILDEKFLIYEDDKYHLTDQLENNYKYCDIDEILDIVSEMEPIEENSFVYDVSNKILSKAFDDKLVNDNNLKNRVELVMEDHNPRSVKMDLSNYITSVLNEKHSLIINMEFADIGNVENFNIKIN